MYQRPHRFFIDPRRPYPQGEQEGRPDFAPYTARDIQKISNAHRMTAPKRTNQEFDYDSLCIYGDARGRRCAYYATNGNLPEIEFQKAFLPVFSQKKVSYTGSIARIRDAYKSALQAFFGQSISFQQHAGWRHLALLTSDVIHDPGVSLKPFRDYHFAKEQGGVWYHYFAGMGVISSNNLLNVEANGHRYRVLFDFWLQGKGRNSTTDWSGLYPRV